MTDELKLVFDDKKRRCEELELEVETKDKECQKLIGEVKNLQKDLEKCQDELKVRVWYDSNTDALEKMLNKQKHSKDTGGLGFDTDMCSTSKGIPNKDI